MSFELKKIDDLDSSEISKIVSIFFENSDVIFKNDREKASFQFKYLDYYIENCSDFFNVSFYNDQICGYICGDINIETIYDLAKYHKYLDLFQNSYKDYPAHLHINLSNRFQGLGIGSKMIEHFCSALLVANCELNGVHIITSEDSRNVNFYSKNGFNDIRKDLVSDSKLILMGKELQN